MDDLDHTAELRHYIRHLQAELSQIVKRAGGRASAPEPILYHAIVRYIECAIDVDMRRLQAEILPHEPKSVLAAKPGRIKCNGFDLLCSKGGVVTVVV